MNAKKVVAGLMIGFACVTCVRGEAVLQIFQLTWNQITQKMPEFAEAGYTAIWVPPITKASSVYSTGYDCFNGFDLGDLNENGTIPTRYGTKEELQNMILTAHRFGIRVYIDSVINHRSFQVPGYDQYTPPTVFSGLLPEDFHLWETPDGFFRQVSQSSFGTVFETEYHGFSGLTDLSEENPNGYFGPNAENDVNTAYPKISFVRQPNNPEYYPDQNLPAIMGMTSANVVTNTYWHPFNGTNGTPTVEDTASYLIRAAMYQMAQTMCDGYRVDAIKHVPSFFYGDYSTSPTSGYTSWYGFTGGLQTIFDYIHGYGYNNPISGYNNTTGNRASCYDTEAIRNDAMIFGEDLGDNPGSPPGAESYDEYFYRGARLEDIQLHNKLYVPVSSILAGGGSLTGFEQVVPNWGSCNFSAYDDGCDFDQSHREMFVGTHDGGVSGTQNRTIVMPYVFMREGLPSVYSDGFNHAAYCSACGGQAFPAITYSQYLGEGTNVNPHTGGYSDEYNLPDEMPEVLYLHGQEARGGTRGLWSDQNLVVFERYDYREVANPSDGYADAYDDPNAAVSILGINDKSYPGDIEFNDQGSGQVPPGANGTRQALAVEFPPARCSITWRQPHRATIGRCLRSRCCRRLPRATRRTRGLLSWAARRFRPAAVRSVS